MDFLRSHLIMNAPLSVDHFQSSLSPKSDELQTSKIIRKYVVKGIFHQMYQEHYSREENYSREESIQGKKLSTTY